MPTLIHMIEPTIAKPSRYVDDFFEGLASIHPDAPVLWDRDVAADFGDQDPNYWDIVVDRKDRPTRSHWSKIVLEVCSSAERRAGWYYRLYDAPEVDVLRFVKIYKGVLANEHGLNAELYAICDLIKAYYEHT